MSYSVSVSNQRNIKAPVQVESRAEHIIYPFIQQVIKDVILQNRNTTTVQICGLWCCVHGTSETHLLLAREKSVGVIKICWMTRLCSCFSTVCYAHGHVSGAQLS